MMSFLKAGAFNLTKLWNRAFNFPYAPEYFHSFFRKLFFGKKKLVGNEIENGTTIITVTIQQQCILLVVTANYFSVLFMNWVLDSKNSIACFFGRWDCDFCLM